MFRYLRFQGVFFGSSKQNHKNCNMFRLVMLKVLNLFQVTRPVRTTTVEMYFKIFIVCALDRILI